MRILRNIFSIWVNIRLQNFSTINKNQMQITYLKFPFIFKVQSKNCFWNLIFDGNWCYWFRKIVIPWWRHQMETFSALLAICAENSPVPGEFPAQRSVTRSFYVFFDLRLNKRLSKQWWGWWFETLSHPLWRHRNGLYSAKSWLWTIMMFLYSGVLSHQILRRITTGSYVTS